MAVDYANALMEYIKGTIKNIVIYHRGERRDR